MAGGGDYDFSSLKYVFYLAGAVTVGSLALALSCEAAQDVSAHLTEPEKQSIALWQAWRDCNDNQAALIQDNLDKAKERARIIANEEMKQSRESTIKNAMASGMSRLEAEELVQYIQDQKEERILTMLKDVANNKDPAAECRSELNLNLGEQLELEDKIFEIVDNHGRSALNFYLKQ